MSWKCIIEKKINIEYFMESGLLIICLIDYNFVVKTIRQKGVTREELNSHNRVTLMYGIYTQVIDF